MFHQRIRSGRAGRRLLAILASSLLISGTLLTAGAVLAVHDEGVFELEGNAVDGNTGVGTGTDPANPQSQPAGGEDWDAVYAETDTAEASSFVTDVTLSELLAGAGDSILSTNTKDIQFIADWEWKQTSSTSVQDKADIEHAFAAQYVIDTTGEQCGTSPGTEECELLYFGADRFSNSGDTVMGFWFFKSAIAIADGGTFTGEHTARAGDDRGDILVVADFRAGGKAPQIQIYEWVTSGGSASAHLDQIGGGDSPASCTQAPPEKANGAPVPPVGANDNFCATANQFVVTSPWPFLAKPNSGGTTGTGGVNTKFGVAEFMEGGINMTALGLGDQCFSSFLAETRASHSVTSTLSDFALGSFGSCGSGITTTPQTGAGATLATTPITADARVAVRDHAEIAVDGTDEAFAGTVQFFLCGPLDLASTENCSTGGVQIGSPAAGEAVSGTAGAASVNSDTATLTSVGRYCWRAVYSGDPLVGVPGSVDPAESVADGGSTSECFTITPLTPVLSTTASADVTLGSPITDTASLTGTAKQPGTDGIGPGGTINATVGSQAAAAGSISFTVKGPDDCDPSGLTVTGSPVTVAGDNASYGPVSATPTAIGKYTFVAEYTGNLPNTLGAGPSSCPPGANDGDEEVNVGTSTTVTTPQRQTDAGPPAVFANITADANDNDVPDVSIGAAARVTVRDHAAITVNGIATWTGEVTFYLCGPADLGTTTLCDTGGVLIGATAKGVSNTTTTADSDPAVLTSVGYYCWRADFTSTTAGVPASSDSSSTECFEVLPLQPVLTTSAGADVTLGSPITDTASLTGTAKQPGTDGIGPGGTINATVGSQAAAAGSISFTVKGPDDCDPSGLTVTGSPVTVAGDNASYGPVSATPTAIGKYTFVAEYTGNLPNTLGAGPSSCPPGANDGDEEVNVGGSAALTTAQRWLPNDTAHVTSTAGTTLAGTVTFNLYPTADCTGTAAYGPITKDVVTDAEAGGTANDRTVSTTNSTFFVTEANDGTAWSWKVSYDDAALSDPTDECETTTPAFTLTD